MRVNRILDVTKAEGPHERLCIWAQGCSRHCEGCFAVDTWDKNGGYEVTADEIYRRIDKVADRIEGITLLGGEPFEQAQELSAVAEYAHSIGLGVITFTGGTYEELKESEDKGVQALLGSTDLLIDGEFELDKREFTRPLVGSSGQRFIFLTDRYSRQEIMSYRNRFEVRVLPSGGIQINGMGDTDKLMAVLKNK